MDALYLYQNSVMLLDICVFYSVLFSDQLGVNTHNVTNLYSSSYD